MRSAINRYLIALMLLASVQSAFGSEASGDRRKSIYIAEPLMLKSAGPLLPVSSAGDQYAFDLAEYPLIDKDVSADGIEVDLYSDIEITYTTSSSADTDVWIYNFKDNRWDQIGHRFNGMSAAVFTRQSHLLSTIGLEPVRYLDDKSNLKLRGRFSDPKIYVVKVNPKYFAASVPVRIEGDARGMAYDGQSYWIVSKNPNRLYKVSRSGEIVGRSDLPFKYPFGLAFDGSSLWLSDGSDRICKLDYNGGAVCQFSVPTDYPSGLALHGAKAWLAEYDGQSPRIFGIDTTPSCASGSAVVTDTIENPVAGNTGLAWDGSSLIVSGSGMLYLLNAAGETIDSFSMPVDGYIIAWDEGALLVLHKGFKGCNAADLMITRFILKAPSKE